VTDLVVTLTATDRYKSEFDRYAKVVYAFTDLYKEDFGVAAMFKQVLPR
jgi:hypothetical protein